MSGKPLTLREELLLVSLDDKKGSYLDGTIIQFGLAGAALMELAARNRIALEDGFLVPVDGPSPRDPGLTEILGYMTEAKRRKKPKAWVAALPGKMKKAREQVAAGLVDRGILKETEETLLWVFPVKRYPERTPVPEREIRDRLRRAVAGSRRIDGETAPLLALVGASKLTKRVVPPERRRAADRRIKELVGSEAFGQVAGETIREIYKALVAVVAASGRS